MFVIKKVNAVLALVLSLVFVDHLMIMSFVMFGWIPYNSALKNSGFAMFYMMIAHVILGLIFMININRNKPKGQLPYTSLNKGSIMQMVFGILGLLFMLAHVFGNIFPNNPVYAGTFSKNPKVPGIMTMMFIGVFWGLHIVLSVPKAAITLGFVHSEKSKRAWTAVISVFVTASVICIFISSIRYFVLGGRV